MSDSITAPPTILLTGADGQVGWELQRSLAPLGRIVAVRRAQLDLTRHAQIREMVGAIAPTVIVNAAAYTAVDLAESERDLALAVNAIAPRVLAEEGARIGAAMVHYSTDYVFDGTKPTPYTEEDAPAPLGVYGHSKLAGDEAVIAAGLPYLVLRTSWVYGARGRNFLRTMLRLAHERTELAVVHDQLGAPTPARLIAEVTALMLGGRPREAGAVFLKNECGVYNLTTRGVASWHEFASAILALDPRRAHQTVARVRAIPSAAYPTPARRPPSSRLDVTKLERTFGLRMPDWHDQLVLVMRELA